MSKKEPEIVTFGCRLNIYESEVMRSHAKNAGLDDAIIFNTCAVTKEAERQARQSIRKARRENPNAKIIVTGCAAQISPEKFADMKEIDQIIGNDIKLNAESWNLKADNNRVLVNDIMSVKETASHLIEGIEGQARAFIQVQNGCNHRCTFCIIPYGRGNSRSVAVGEIVKQVKKLVSSGYNEIVMTGVDVTSYGADLPGNPTLGQMIRRVLNLVPELPRIRLSSLDPVEIDDDLWWLIENEKRLMPHLHLSLQAGDNMILKRMKRRHLRDDAINVCKKAKKLRPDIVFGADMIAGFPTETDEMFANSLKIIDECNLTFLHIFPYSEREGTPAAKMPQINKNIRKERAAKLREAGNKKIEEILKTRINKTEQVIVEKGNIGRTEQFLQVRLNNGAPTGSLAKVKITGVEDNFLLGQIVS